MTTMMFWLCGAVFAGLPPFLFGSRLVRGRPGWWAILITILLVGWASWFGANAFYFQELGERIEATENPSPELVERWAGDGGPMVFALLFGWAFAAAYAVPWYLIYLMALFLRKTAFIASGRELLPPEAYRPPGRRL